MNYNQLSDWEREEVVLKTLEVYPHGMSANDLAKTLEISTFAAKKVLSSLAMMGKVSVKRIGWRTIYFSEEI